jgi:hypothetical protein
MVRLYTQKQRTEVLKSLSIKPVNGMVTGKEAASILSWRAKEEHGVIHTYDPSSLRRHVEQKNITPIPVSPRKNMYKVETVFELPIAPTRGRGANIPVEGLSEEVA